MENPNNNTKVVKSICFPCHANCGVMVHIKDGRVVKIEGDPDYPANEGAMCVRGLAFTQLLYHPDRLKYPIKRVGEKGSGKWQRISWDEALDTIASKIKASKDKYGPESLAMTFCDGHGASGAAGCILLDELGSPMKCRWDAHYCLRPQAVACNVTFGKGNYFTGRHGFDLANSKCILSWGANLLESQPSHGQEIIKALKNGAKLIAIDPRFTNLASKANLWLRIRPATDGALALGMLNYIIEQELYDKEFVDKCCFGFEQLKERVKEYPISKVSEITWVPEEDIRQAATMYATTKPASLVLFMGLSMNTNAMQAMRAVHMLIAVTGNVDVKGGHLIFDYDHLPKSADGLPSKLSKEEMAKAPGAKERPMFYGKESIMPAHSHPPSFLDMLLTGEPYKIRFAFSVTDPVMGFQSSKKVLEALRDLDFFVDMDFFITPTASVADIVLPQSTYLEQDKVWTHNYNSFYSVSEKAIEPVGECRNEVEVFSELAHRLGIELPTHFKSVEELNKWLLSPTGKTFDELRGKGAIKVPIEYKRYEKEGYLFPTETGKIELYSKHYEKYGYDPLPYYEEPPQSPYSTPELFKQYPLILISGSRANCFYHGMGRQIPWLRELYPEPTVEIHPDTAENLGIKDGDWVWIETSQMKGRVKQKAELTLGIHPKVVHARSHWWFPERADDPELGCIESNINAIMSTSGSCDPISGSTMVRGCLCKIYKVK